MSANDPLRTLRPQSAIAPSRVEGYWTRVFLNLDRIRAAPVRELPYRYFSVLDALFPAEAIEAADAFPQVDRAGAVSADLSPIGPAFVCLLDELRGDEFRNLIGKKLDLDLSDKEVVINVRGRVRVTDGNIHTDAPTKLATVLLYFNREGEGGDTGLRILNGPDDIDDFAEEVPPVLGSMVAFKVTQNCWHGHKPFSGERHSLQLNYLSGIERNGKHEGSKRFWSHLRRRVGLA